MTDFDYIPCNIGVLGVDRKDGLSRRDFRDLVDIVLTEWGFVKCEESCEPEEEVVGIRYKGTGEQEIDATFVGDNVGDNMAYDLDNDWVNDRFLVDFYDAADAALVFYNVSDNIVTGIDGDLSKKVCE